MEPKNLESLLVNTIGAAMFGKWCARTEMVTQTNTISYNGANETNNLFIQEI